MNLNIAFMTVQIALEKNIIITNIPWNIFINIFFNHGLPSTQAIPHAFLGLNFAQFGTLLRLKKELAETPRMYNNTTNTPTPIMCSIYFIKLRVILNKLFNKKIPIKAWNIKTIVMLTRSFKETSIKNRSVIA